MLKGKRYNKGKPEWSLVDFNALVPMVRVLEYGTKKYSRDNWKGGLKKNEILESLARHLFSMMDGELYDKESGELHVGHILCNAMFWSYFHQKENPCKK